MSKTAEEYINKRAELLKEGEEVTMPQLMEEYAKEQNKELIEMLNKAKEKLYTVESPSTSCRYLADEITDLLTKYK